MAEKITQLIQEGEISEINEILETVPATVLDIFRIPGLGPKKAAALYQELGIQTLEQLQAACEASEVQKLKGFAAKTEQSILEGMEIATAANERIYWSEADQLAGSLSTVWIVRIVGQLNLPGATVMDVKPLVTSTFWSSHRTLLPSWLILVTTPI